MHHRWGGAGLEGSRVGMLRFGVGRLSLAFPLPGLQSQPGRGTCWKHPPRTAPQVRGRPPTLFQEEGEAAAWMGCAPLRPGALAPRSLSAARTPTSGAAFQAANCPPLCSTRRAGQSRSRSQRGSGVPTVLCPGLGAWTPVLRAGMRLGTPRTLLPQLPLGKRHD